MKIKGREIEHEIVKFDSNIYTVNDVLSTPIYLSNVDNVSKLQSKR